MTGRVLGQIASSTRHLLLDFDGPVCAIFAGTPNSTVASQLRDSLRAADIPVPTEVDAEPDPLTVFQSVAMHSPDAAEAAQQLLAMFETRAVATAKPTPGSADLIVTAYRTGRTVTIVSNNSEAAIRAYLDDHQLSDYIRAVLGRDHNPAKMKPSPYQVRMAIMSLDADPGECAFVGDSPTDVIAGRLAGVPVIGYANKPGKADTLTRAQADAVTTDLADITAAFHASNRAQATGPNCRIEPFLDQGGACGAAGAPAAGLSAWGARPARARQRRQEPQTKQAHSGTSGRDGAIFLGSHCPARGHRWQRANGQRPRPPGRGERRWRSPGEDQRRSKQALAARQRVRGNTTPHPEVKRGCLPEPVKGQPTLDRTRPTRKRPRGSV